MLSCSRKGVCLLTRSKRRVSGFWRTCLSGILLLYWWPLGVYIDFDFIFETVLERKKLELRAEAEAELRHLRSHFQLTQNWSSTIDFGGTVVGTGCEPDSPIFRGWFCSWGEISSHLHGSSSRAECLPALTLFLGNFFLPTLLRVEAFTIHVSLRFPIWGNLGTLLSPQLKS